MAITGDYYGACLTGIDDSCLVVDSSDSAALALKMSGVGGSPSAEYDSELPAAVGCDVRS